MREKSKSEIELLIRKPRQPGDSKAGFTTKRFVANEVALSVRPRRIPPESCEIQEQERKGGAASYVVKNVATGNYLFLSETEYFLWQKMDGDHTLRAIATAYFFRFGSFDFRMIQNFLVRAKEHELIIMPRTDLIRTVQEPRDSDTLISFKVLDRVSSFNVRISNVDERLTRLYLALRILFSKPAMVIYVCLILAGSYAFGELAMRDGIIDVSTLWLFVPFLVPGYLLTVTIHELAHALTCKHYGREVREFGFRMLGGIFPSVYADVTDIWMSTRGARIAVSFAGPFSGIVLGALSVVAAWLLFPSWAASLFLCLGTTVVIAALINLYPFLFLELDGYHMLIDVVQQPALRELSVRFIRRDLWVKLRAGRKLSGDDVELLAYALISIASVLGILSFVVVVILRGFWS
jgi:putative peptide zinc metalloprotease protein